MRHSRWCTACALSAAVTAALVTSATGRADAGAVPGPAVSPGPGLAGLVSPLLPSLPPLPVPLPATTRPPALPPLPALPLPPVGTPPAVRPTPAPVPAPPAGSPTGAREAVTGPAAPQPGPAGPVPAPPQASAQEATTDNASAVIAADPGADLYPQPPVDPATTPRAQLIAKLNEVQHRVQYLQNTLARTRADLAIAQQRLGAVPTLITFLTGPATGAAPTTANPGTSVNTPEGRVLVLTSAVAGGQAELDRRQDEVRSLQQQVASTVRQAMTAAVAVAPAAPAGYRGGRLLRPVPGAVTSPFGNRFDPYYHVWQLHAGLDIGAPAGTPIVAAAPGRVVQAGWSGGYGNYTCIEHGRVDGERLTTCYGHQQAIGVAVGQQVGAGQVIGRVGSTGASTGPHLHFEVRLGGRPVDPAAWL
ncbi:M23 family metallopeptidase [Planosporangium sp. 12N6]|uniref:M23 family metallopeptidase n=1 Tax=Planosporangium spinosum TaxID=3402278 RepID=UPI003CEE2AB7